jgi:acyl carrier protein
MDTPSIELRVRGIIIETTGSPFAAPLVDTTLDSLTLVAVVARIEAVFAVSFDTDETITLLGARSSNELARLIARKIAEGAKNLDEPAKNNGCCGAHKPP